MDNIKQYRLWLNSKKLIKDRLSLTEDKADDAVIDERIRGDVEMRGTNLWVLIFAIFIASIGLNVNSTAVIIGAMLISPLMGPIMGIGYGAGINDFSLIRRSFYSLMFATFVALLTSTLYFLISPLDTAQSELLARTTPTLWDVLIGLFGGLAGIVALTRKEKSNVIPGVAIATALMPPLCTAGFGLASGNWEFFFGAFYLYTINFVFIALASFLIVRLFNITEKKYVDPKVAVRAQRTIAAVVLLTLLPSSYLAYQLVTHEVFNAKASDFVTENFSFKTSNVAQVNINSKTKEIKVFVIGEHIPQLKLDEIRSQLPKNGLGKAVLTVYQNGSSKEVDVSMLKADIITDLYQNSQIVLQAKEKMIQDLQQKLAKNEKSREELRTLSMELKTIFPKVNEAILSEKIDQNGTVQSHLILNAKTTKHLNRQEYTQIEKWLKIRAQNNNVTVIIR